jgi:hypothetical protein
MNQDSFSLATIVISVVAGALHCTALFDGVGPEAAEI